MRERERSVLACAEALSNLLETVKLYAERIPRPNGFFVGSEERQKAFRAIYRLLTVAEPQVMKLQSAIAQLASGKVASADDTDAYTAHMECCRAWRCFYGQSVTLFLSRLGEIADLEKGGEECDSSAASSLCREFCRASEDFLKQYADQDR